MKNLLLKLSALWKDSNLTVRYHAQSYGWCGCVVSSKLPRRAPPSIPTLMPDHVHHSVWKKPEGGDLKCNVASSWINWETQSGASWILHNEYGETLLHSRRAYAKPDSEVHAALLSLLWAVESMMHSHHRVLPGCSKRCHIFTCILSSIPWSLWEPPEHAQSYRFMVLLPCVSNRKQSLWKHCLIGDEGQPSSILRGKKWSVLAHHDPPIWRHGYSVLFFFFFPSEALFMPT